MEWPMVELNSVADILGGSTPRRDNPVYWNGDIPWVTPTDLPALGEGISELNSTTEAITNEGLASCSARLLPPGTVLFSSRATIGKVGIATVPLTTNQGFANFIPKSGVESRYLAWCLHHAADRIAGLAGSTTFKEVSKSSFGRFRIPIPPLSEQRRIVDILDQADRLRRLRAEAAAKAARILPALFIKMFGDPATNPMGWPVHKLSELSSVGPQYGANARSADLAPGHPRYVRITDVDDFGRLQPANAVGVDMSDWEPYRLMAGDLLFARSGATVGKSYIHRPEYGPCVFGGYLIRFRLNKSKLHPLFAFAFTQTSVYRGWVNSKRRTAAQPNINGKEYASLSLPVPDRELQDCFCEVFSRMEDTHRSSVYSREGLENLFSVLLNRAFSGAIE